MSAPDLKKAMLAEGDLDMNHFQLLNLDTSNLNLNAIPPSVAPPNHNFLNGWDATTKTWSYAQPSFDDLSGFLNRVQMRAITSVGTVISGTWQASPLSARYVPSLDGITPPANDVSMAGKKLINLGLPVNPGDAVNLQYIDGLLQGLSVKAPVKAMATGNMTPATLDRPVDGISISAGDRVLLAFQTNPAENGIYIAATGAWSRSPDCNTADLINGAYCLVLQGTTYAGTSWVQVDVVANINTDPKLFVEFSTASATLAGAGLNKTGQTIFAVGTAHRITIASAIDIASDYAGQGSITTLGTISAGNWEGTIIAPAYGGTGNNNDPYQISLGADLGVSLDVGVVSGTLNFVVQGTTSVKVPRAGTLATVDQAETFTNKRITKRLIGLSSGAQPAMNTDIGDVFSLPSLTTNITSLTVNLTGTPNYGDHIEVWIRDDGTSRNIVWGSSFIGSSAVLLPSSTSPNLFTVVLFSWNPFINQWVALSATNAVGGPHP